MTLKTKVLIALSLLMPLSVCAKVCLVSVGIADYPGTSSDLRLPTQDAQTMTWLYSRNTDLVHCQLLNGNATRAKVIAAMNRTFSQAKEDDIVVFYYSGHGYPGGFCMYDGNISYGEIRNAMAGSNCKNKMIFADACFSGKMRTSGKRYSQSSVVSAKKANVMLFLSSRSREVSFEYPSMQNGLFTSYLQKGLRGSADINRDRVITARELFEYVHKNVINESKDRQHPVMWGKFPDDMPVMKWN